MTFLERKKNRGFSDSYEYSCVDVFGELEIKSFHKLDAETLDLISMTALKDTPVGSMKGISWELSARNEWEEVKSLENEPISKFKIKNLWAFIRKIVKR